MSIYTGPGTLTIDGTAVTLDGGELVAGGVKAGALLIHGGAVGLVREVTGAETAELYSDWAGPAAEDAEDYEFLTVDSVAALLRLTRLLDRIEGDLDGMLLGTGTEVAPMVDVPSATSCDIGGAESYLVRITGTETINEFANMANKVRVGVFTGSLLLRVGPRDIQTQAGDTFIAFGNAAGGVNIINGDMLASMYDPTNVEADAFSIDNMHDVTTFGRALAKSADAAAALATIGAAPLGGYLYGLVLANGPSDWTSNLDIASGECADNTGSVLLRLPTMMTKRLNDLWSPGSGNGGRDAGSIANGTWHVHVIGGADVPTDILFSHSLSPVMPSGYTYRRRIGSMLREGGSWIAFRQHGDVFWRGNIAADRDSTAEAIDVLLALSVPSGITVEASLQMRIYCTGGNTSVGIADGSFGFVSNQGMAQFDGSGVASVIARVQTNTDRQIRFTQRNWAGIPYLSQLYTFGWVDTRGRMG